MDGFLIKRTGPESVRCAGRPSGDFAHSGATTLTGISSYSGGRVLSQLAS